MSWMLGLGEALQQFGKSKMLQDEETRRAEADKRQYDLQQQQLQRALAKDKLDETRQQQQDARQAAQDLYEATPTGSSLSDEMQAILKKGNMGWAAGNTVQSNAPSWMLGAGMQPMGPETVLQPNRKETMARDERMADTARRQAEFQQQQAAERSNIELRAKLQAKENAQQAGAAMARLKEEFRLRGEQETSTGALLQAFPQFLQGTASIDPETGVKVFNTDAALSAFKAFYDQYKNPAKAQPQPFTQGSVKPVASHGGGPPVGTRGVVNGQPAQWDGKGWLPLGSQ